MNHSATTTPFSKRSWRLRPGERRGTLIFGDFLVALLALVGGLYIWSQGNEWLNFSWQFLQERVPVWFYFMPLIWMLLLIESYDTRRSSARLETVKEISLAAGVSLAIYLIVFFIFNSDSAELPRRGVISFIGFAYILTLVWRFVYIGLFNTPQFMRRVIIVGAGKSGSQLVKIIHGIWPPPFYTIGLVDDDPDKLGTEIEGLKILGSSANLFELVQQHQATDLIFSIMGDMDSEVFEKVLEAEERGIEVTTMPIVYEELLGRVPIFLLKSDWVLRSFVDQAHVGGFYDLAKRLIDIIGGLFGTFILGISFPFIGTAILLESGFPIFYYQERLGKNGRPYKMIKYRSMVQDAEADGIARASADDDHRTTFIGRFLRKSHLDELPQFINILRGDMSIVGPRAERPELIEQLQQHIPFYRARLFVKPGLSGWAQINFGYANDYESNGIKLEYDLYYIKHRNLLLDFNIMIRTVGTVIGLRGH